MKYRNQIKIAIALFVVAAFAMFAVAAVNTPSKSGKSINLTVSNDAVIPAGVMVAVDSSAEAVVASDTASIQVVGRASETVDNSDDGETIDVDVGIFRWANGGSFDDSNIGDICYVLASNRVATASTTTNDIIAGVIVDVDSSGVWVKTMEIDRTAGAFTTLSASGASDLQSTVAVGGHLTVATTKDIKFGADGTSEIGSAANRAQTLYCDAFNIDGRSLLVAETNTVYAFECGNFTTTGGGTITNGFTTSFASTNDMFISVTCTTAGWSTNAVVTPNKDGVILSAGQGAADYIYMAVGRK